MVDKRIIFLIMFGGTLWLIFGLANLALADAVQIPNPLRGIDNFGELLLKIAGAVGGLVAALGTIMIIVAGILYLTSAGSPERITKAKTALMYAIVGIAIGLAATAIVEAIKSVIGVRR